MDAWSKQMKQDEIKLDILQSLARSQKALARIIESMADVIGTSEKTSQKLLTHIAEISHYQKILAVRMTGIHLHNNKRYGKPTKPWLQSQLNLTKRNQRK